MDREKSITLEFVKELISTFREQKLLHRKYMLQVSLSSYKRNFFSILVVSCSCRVLH